MVTSLIPKKINDNIDVAMYIKIEFFVPVYITPIGISKDAIVSINSLLKGIIVLRYISIMPRAVIMPP